MKILFSRDNGKGENKKRKKQNRERGKFSGRSRSLLLEGMADQRGQFETVFSALKWVENIFGLKCGL